MLTRGLTRRLLMTLATAALLAAPSQADLVQVTYQVSASGFQTSLGNRPPPPTSSSVSGIYTFTFDPTASQTGIAPDAVVGLDITKADGTIIDFDETNSGADVAISVAFDRLDVTLGGNVSTVGFMVGLSDDFRVRFRASLTGLDVQLILENFGFVTTVDPGFGAQSTTVTLLQASTSYCTAGTSASGCQATLSASGAASAGALAGYVVTASNLEGNKPGLFFFGTNGRQANPWGSGSSFQCVTPPVTRAPILAGTGTPGLCDGLLAQDFNTLWSTTPAKNPGAGAVVQAQLWYRDPLTTSNQTTSLSDAIEFNVNP